MTLGKFWDKLLVYIHENQKNYKYYFFISIKIQRTTEKENNNYKIIFYLNNNLVLYFFK